MYKNHKITLFGKKSLFGKEANLWNTFKNKVLKSKFMMNSIEKHIKWLQSVVTGIYNRTILLDVYFYFFKHVDLKELNVFWEKCSLSLILNVSICIADFMIGLRIFYEVGTNERKVFSFN